MKIHTSNKNFRRQGFTLIEMIGVLAVIAILAAVLIPKVFEAINSSRINNAAMTCQTAKTALVDHYAKYGVMAVDGTTTPPTAATAAQMLQFDLILLKEQLVDKPFQTKIGLPNLGDGTQTRVSLMDLSAAVAGTTAVDATSATFDLDGAGGAVSDITGSYAAVGIIEGVQLSDAYELSKRVDGDQLSAATPTGADLLGRVKYLSTANPTDVYVYLTHR